MHRTIVLAVALLGLAPAAQAQTVLYEAARVYPISGPKLSPGQVLVVDGKISAVGRSVAAPAGAQVVDLGDATLLPGLVDAYGQAGLAGGTDEFTREITPEFEAARVIDWKARDLRQALSRGTTTLAVAPGTENVIAGLSCVIKTAGQSRDQRFLTERGALLISLCSDPGRRNSARRRPDGIYNRLPTNRMGVVWLLRSTFDRVRRGEELESAPILREVLAGERAVFSVSRTSYDLSSLLTVSEELGLKPVAVGAQEAYRLADRLAEAQVPVILGPLEPGSLRGPERTEPIWNQAGVLAEAGVTFALSGGDLLAQARFAHRFGLSEEQALAAITEVPATLLGVGDRVGTLTAGRDADMIALDGDPLEFTTALRWVMVNGTIIELQKGEGHGTYDL